MDGGGNSEGDQDSQNYIFSDLESDLSDESPYVPYVNEHIPAGILGSTSNNYFGADGEHILEGIQGESTSNNYFGAYQQHTLEGIQDESTSNNYFGADQQRILEGIHEESTSNNYYGADGQNVLEGIQGESTSNNFVAYGQQLLQHIQGESSNNYFGAVGQQLLEGIQGENYFGEDRQQIPVGIQGSTSNNFGADGQQILEGIHGGSNSNNFFGADGQHIVDGIQGGSNLNNLYSADGRQILDGIHGGSTSNNFFGADLQDSCNLFWKATEQVLPQSPLLAAAQNLQLPYIPPSYQPSQMMSATQAQLVQHQLALQHMQQQENWLLDQQIRLFWTTQYSEVTAQDFKNHSLPLSRIKRIMRFDEEVRMVAGEAPILFARACEMFILELTYRAWAYSEENNRRTLQKSNVAAAIIRTKLFDFLVDIVQKEESKEEGASPMAGPSDPTVSFPYNSYMFPQAGPLPMTMAGPGTDYANMMYAQQPQAYISQQLWEQQQSNQHQQQPSDDS